MAVWDTKENQRTKFTKATLECFEETVDLDRHRIIVVDNNSCEETKDILNDYFDRDIIDLITLTENVGTAKAVNMAWKHRTPKEHCLKCDNDVDILSYGWLDELEEAIDREPKIGQCGLKRFELEERPDNPNPAWKSELIMLPHKRGQSWIVFEKCAHVLGTCVLHNYRLIDKAGALVQPTSYGFDDSIYSLKSILAGFWNGFLPYIPIIHLDEGGNDYTKWKQKHAGEIMKQYEQMRNDYASGKRPLYDKFE